MIHCEDRSSGSAPQPQVPADIAAKLQNIRDVWDKMLGREHYPQAFSQDYGYTASRSLQGLLTPSFLGCTAVPTALRDDLINVQHTMNDPDRGRKLLGDVRLAFISLSDHLSAAEQKPSVEIQAETMAKLHKLHAGCQSMLGSENAWQLLPSTFSQTWLYSLSNTLRATLTAEVLRCPAMPAALRRDIVDLAASIEINNSREGKHTLQRDMQKVFISLCDFLRPPGQEPMDELKLPSRAP